MGGSQPALESATSVGGVGLALELAQKRLRWQQDREKYRTLRILSFSFLSLVILAGLIGFFFFFTRAKDAREQHPAPSPTLSPH